MIHKNTDTFVTIYGFFTARLIRLLCGHQSVNICGIKLTQRAPIVSPVGSGKEKVASHCEFSKCTLQYTLKIRNGQRFEKSRVNWGVTPSLL